MKLKPCPFCGGGDMKHDSEWTQHFLVCPNCGANGPVVSGTGHKSVRDSAERLWNTRHKEPTEADKAAYDAVFSQEEKAKHSTQPTRHKGEE